MIWRKGGEVRGYDKNPGSGDKETQKGTLERLIGLNDCLCVLAWAGNEERSNSKMLVIQTEHAGGAGLV